MAVLYVTEYASLMPSPVGATGQVPAEAPLVEQTIAIGGGSVASSAFNASTRLVRIHTDAICSIKFGTAPTASATTQRLAANQTQFHGVPTGQSFKVAVITNT